MSRRQSERKVVPKLSHEEAAKHLVEYHFGRLSPAMSAAVEAHVRGCRSCQRQGLDHAATEKRQIDRRIRRLKPGGARKLTRRGRTLIVLLVIVVLLQVAVIKIATGASSPFAGLFGAGAKALATHTPSSSGATNPAPALLAPATVYDPAAAGVDAVAASPDGKLIAIARMVNASPQVAVWPAGGSAPSETLTWPGTAVPGALAWSPDSTAVAVADGSAIAVWTVSTPTPTWSVTLPAAPALRVYDTQTGEIVQRPDVTTAFAHGTSLTWDSDGHVVSAPADGSATVPTTGSGRINLWRSSGSHIYADGASGAVLGISAADATAREALLAWSPDGRYLLWAATSQPLATAATPASSTASATVGTNVGSAELTAPNASVQKAAANVAASGQGDALIWFSPNGRTEAICDRSTSGAALTIYDDATSRKLATLADACDGLMLSSLAWTPASSGIILAVPGKSVALYPFTMPTH